MTVMVADRVSPMSIEDIIGRWPARLYWTQNSRGLCGCYCFGGVHGLAVFSEVELAKVFADVVFPHGYEVKEGAFDEAREVAKSRPLPVVAMLLMDDPDNPQVHYVR